ncbi:MAG: CotH kinase family protein, partial [Anaerolineae bacterium]|nr:CotH kinase family protein [Anaerolineae bacterium]
FADGVLQQPANPPGFPTTWGVHNRNVLAYVKGTPVIADYEMDPDVVNDPRYSPTFVDDLKSIPSLSIVTDVENLEIYANPRQRGRIWERPVSVELIDPRLYQQGFQIDAGLRLHGGVGRNEAVPKHSMRLFFRGEYGATKLEYPLFPDSPVQTFETLVLRAGTNRSYAGRYNSQHHLTTYTRDEWARRTQLAMSGVSPRGRFVHLYLNGLYWGLYNLVERPDSAFTAAYFGGQEEAWYVRDQDGSVSGSLNETVLTLILMAMETGSAGFENPQIYSMVKSSLDTSQFSDYMILNWYIGNNDWPYNNWIAAVRNPEGRLQFFVWDAESIFKRGAEIRLQGLHGGPPTLDALRTMTALELEKEYESNPIAYVFLALMANDDFKMEFADRVFTHLFNDGALTEARAQARWRQLNAIIDRAIVGESARWGDARYETPIVREDWLNAIDVVLAQMEGNDAKLVALMREAGYYPPIDPPAFSPHAVLVETGFELTMMAPTPDSTEIYYTTDGSDPRLEVTGQISPSAIAYRTPIVLSSTTHIKARALKGDIWSALNEATFTTAGDIGQLQITEIMYNPPGGSDYEYIELKNVGLTPVRLAGATFEGIDYTFPIATPLLASGEFIVLASNSAAFTERYPDVSLSGAFQAQLSNGGEEITLRDIQAKVIIAVNYDDELGWPISPDGLGDSLVLVSPEGDPNDPRSWRASTNLYGSPGTDDPARLARP